MNSFGPRIEPEPFFSSSPFEPHLPPVISLEDVDLTDKALYASGDPHAVFRLLRREAPIFWHAKSGAAGHGGEPFWAVTSYEGFTKVLGDPETFSNKGGPMVDLSAEATGLIGTLATAEGNFHSIYRGAVQDHTGPVAIAAAQDEIQRRVRSALLTAVEAGEFDAGPFAQKLPADIANAFLELTGEEAAAVHRINDADREDPCSIAEFKFSTFEKMLIDRRTNPRKDVFTALARDEDSGALTHEQVMKYISILFAASFVGMHSAVHNTIVTLVHHPQQFQMLKQHPEYIENGTAVEEILRWAGHSMHLTRRATSAAEIHGQKIKAGDLVVSFNASANRDETVFEDPYVLNLSRKRRRVMTFSTGPHQCLGQLFVRATVKALLRELTQNFETLEQAGPIFREEPYTVLASHIKSMPIRSALSSIRFPDHHLIPPPA